MNLVSSGIQMNTMLGRGEEDKRQIIVTEKIMAFTFFGAIQAFVY